MFYNVKTNWSYFQEFLTILDNSIPLKIDDDIVWADKNFKYVI